MSEMRRLLRALAEGDEPSEVWDYFARPPVLETPRLIIRPAKMRDAEDVFRYASDPEVARYVLWTPHRTPADSRSFIRSLQRQYRASQPSSCLCVLRETGAAVGSSPSIRKTNSASTASFFFIAKPLSIFLLRICYSCLNFTRGNISCQYPAVKKIDKKKGFCYVSPGTPAKTEPSHCSGTDKEFTLL